MLTINNYENMHIMRLKNVNRYKNVPYAALELRQSGTGEEADHWKHGEETDNWEHGEETYLWEH